MYIVPIALHKRSPDTKQMWVLLERNGTHLMSLEAGSGAREFADGNGLALTGDPIQVGELMFLSVDMTQTDFSAFYSWREVVPGTVPPKEVWRQFTWVSDSLDVNTLLNEIIIGDPDHTVYSVLNAYLKAKQ
jgi:hypothetical protein